MGGLWRSLLFCIQPHRQSGFFASGTEEDIVQSIERKMASSGLEWRNAIDGGGIPLQRRKETHALHAHLRACSLEALRAVGADLIWTSIYQMKACATIYPFISILGHHRNFKFSWFFAFCFMFPRVSKIGFPVPTNIVNDNLNRQWLDSWLYLPWHPYPAPVSLETIDSIRVSLSTFGAFTLICLSCPYFSNI